ncbi:hypothetical protein MAE02_62310 [Microvirga aerophila]|uniref:Uncharacterized protein n=1 Tax=Microvirga aerophila TaxID=670291 RepID=A0A512C2U7_9HYPH|nr:hypothetical protein MAE02_62310 [Microvirga aerophila]
MLFMTDAQLYHFAANAVLQMSEIEFGKSSWHRTRLAYHMQGDPGVMLIQGWFEALGLPAQG